MSDDKFCIFARISPKEEHFDDAKNAVTNILKQTQDEPGCIQFELHENRADKALFLYEEWVNDSALDEHCNKPYTTAIFESFQEWLAEPVDVVRMNKCEAE